VLILADCFDDGHYPKSNISLDNRSQVTACNTALDPV
jgi:hypothetical protein